MGFLDRLRGGTASQTSKPEGLSPSVVAQAPHPTGQPAEAAVRLSQVDLDDMAMLLDEWYAVTDAQDNDRIWATLERIGTRGGYPGIPEMLRRTGEMQRGGPRFDTNHAMQTSWRWMAGVAALARQGGDNVLTGRVFLFMHYWELLLAPKMRVNDFASTGIAIPDRQHREAIASEAVLALQWVRPDLLIDNVTPAGAALDWAKEVASGVQRRVQ